MVKGVTRVAAERAVVMVVVVMVAVVSVVGWMGLVAVVAKARAAADSEAVVAKAQDLEAVVGWTQVWDVQVGG